MKLKAGPEDLSTVLDYPLPTGRFHGQGEGKVSKLQRDMVRAFDSRIE